MIKTHQLKGNTLVDRLKKLSKPINENVVSMVEPPKYHNRISPTSKLRQTFDKPEDIEDMDDDQEIDLEQILREMGYGDDEVDLGDSNEDDIREYVRNIVREKFEQEMSDDDFEDELKELIDELEDEMIMDEVLEEMGMEYSE